MSSRAPFLFNSTLILATNTTLYTVPSDVSTEILTGLSLRITNYTTTATTVTVHAIPSGGSATNTNAQCKDLNVPAKSSVTVQVEPLVAGGVVSAIASAATRLNAKPVSGYKIHNPS